MALRKSDSIYDRVRQILESARASVARSVNTTQVVAYWLIGREIVEEEQKGQKRAGYGDALLMDLARRLKADFGSGYSVNNLKFIRQLYFTYPKLIGSREIGYALRSQFSHGLLPASKPIRHAAHSESWKHGQLHPNLSWTHYRTLLRVDKPEGDGPTLGLILCADKNDAVVKYTLGPEQEKKIFASRYKLHLPTEAELKAEIRRELRSLQSGDRT